MVLCLIHSMEIQTRRQLLSQKSHVEYRKDSAGGAHGQIAGDTSLKIDYQSQVAQGAPVSVNKTSDNYKEKV